MWAPPLIYIYNKRNIFFADRFIFILFYFILKFYLASLFDIRESDCQNSSRQEAKCSTQRGLRVGTKNMGFRRVFI